MSIQPARKPTLTAVSRAAESAAIGSSASVTTEPTTAIPPKSVILGNNICSGNRPKQMDDGSAAGCMPVILLRRDRPLHRRIPGSGRFTSGKTKRGLAAPNSWASGEMRAEKDRPEGNVWKGNPGEQLTEEEEWESSIYSAQLLYSLSSRVAVYSYCKLPTEASRHGIEIGYGMVLHTGGTTDNTGSDRPDLLALCGRGGLLDRGGNIKKTKTYIYRGGDGRGG
ncbi:hypothetical protein BDZ91DRAFT_766801 [Kalaharituber pfeilii]|nr:hypothetical protein BDZ91DRAFT_766801 [Kalaharituber pfeilii]